GNFSFVASEINAFDPLTGLFEGTIPIDPGRGNTAGGLWGLIFGNGGNGGNPNVLYFADGINGERDGLFAAISVPEPSSLMLLVGAMGLLSALYRVARRAA
ncbi:MAG: PEP-CTERM sorting domain-containing protein, partial [Alphaproteobacteria bacterium]